MIKKNLPFWFALMIFLQSTSYASAQKIGVFDAHQDVGTNVKPSSATFIPETGQYVISAAGYNVRGHHDEFQFVWKKMKGYFILYTKAEFLGNWVDYHHRKVGWMVRKTLDRNSPHINAVEDGDGLTSLQLRRTTGGVTEEIKSKITKGNIIQLERKGKTYTMRVAKYGEPFVTEEVTDFDLGDEVCVGLFVGSHSADILETGVFRDVRITVPFAGRPTTEHQ